MRLSFTSHRDGVAVRDVLRKNGVSAALMRAVKNDAGFFCNDTPVHTDARTRQGDVISFSLPPEPPTAVQPQDLPLAILYEDAHAMVLEKPAGLTMHPTRGYADGTLANAFCGLMCRRGRSVPFRPVNRLDRGTSGLVLCAMNAWAAPLLAASVQKEYYAVAQGEMPVGEGAFDAPIALEPGSLIRRCVSPEGSPSTTRYAVLAAGGGVSLAACTPVTGRTHQIRVHFSFAGHPLAGDDLYGGARDRIGRPALHCGRMRFTVPGTDVSVLAQAPLAPDMRQLLPAMDAAACMRLPNTHGARIEAGAK